MTISSLGLAVLRLGKNKKAEKTNQMIKFVNILQVFKLWESLIKANEEFKTGVQIKAIRMLSKNKS